MSKPFSSRSYSLRNEVARSCNADVDDQCVAVAIVASLMRLSIALKTNVLRGRKERTTCPRQRRSTGDAELCCTIVEVDSAQRPVGYLMVNIRDIESGKEARELMGAD
jgi:hypothetical protein